MIILTNKFELLFLLEMKKYSKRDDSLSDQMTDMLSVFVNFGWHSLAHKISKKFNIRIHKKSSRYEDVIKEYELRFKHNDEMDEIKHASKVAELLGCTAAANSLHSCL